MTDAEPVIIRGNHIKVTRLDATGQPIGEAQHVPLKRLSMEMKRNTVDPDLLALLTGSYPDGNKPVSQSMWITGTHPWKWWQWQRWLRRPRRVYSYYFPSVTSKIEAPDGND